jgi:hypothetical protein
MNGFHGLPTRYISYTFIQLEVLEHAGPRIVRLRFRGSANLFAEVPDFVIPTDFGDYHMWGGHRLWHAPEAMPRTYFPDDEGNVITELQDGLLLQGRIEPHTGLRKSIEVHLAGDKPEVRLVHTLSNHGSQIVELAPWPITQLRLGGIVIAPMPIGNSDPHGLLPNRQISLWPYTRIRDTRIHWDDDFLLLKADAGLPPFKIGYFNPHGWLAYWIDGVLFRKVTDVYPGASYPDGNCNAEIFCNDRFVELESLGPLNRIAPGERVQTKETWELFDGLEHSGVEDVIDRISRLLEFR